MLDDLTAASARWVPGAIVGDRGRADLVLPAGHRDPGLLGARLLDEFQQRYLEGPCLHAAWTRKVVVVDDLRTDSRWPKYQADAAVRSSSTCGKSAVSAE
ncbi:hypothetical protein MAHJHV35_48280 [Mycobacterium avium subsp. hominissuis]